MRAASDGRVVEAGSAIPTAAARFVLAAGVISLSAANLFWRDPLLQWQPAPADAAWRAALGVGSGLTLASGALALLFRRTARAGALVLTAAFSLWALLLHGPRVLAHPDQVVLWLGLAEIGALAVVSALLFSSMGASRRPARRLLFLLGACMLVFGLSHLAYPRETTALVPSWLPAREALAWLTGAAHIAAGGALVSGLLVRTAAALWTVMTGGFVLLLHLPRVWAAPESRLEWTMLALASALTAGGAAVALLSSTRAEKI